MMKNVLKIVLCVFALLALTTTKATAQLLPISLSVKGGPNFSTVSTSAFEGKTGFNAGLGLDVNLPANLAIMSGLEINTKGANTKQELEAIDASQKINAMYLQLPVHLGYRIKLLPGFRMHFELGPYFAQGIGGKTKYMEKGKEVKADTFGDDGLKKFDWGLGAAVGVTLLGRVQVKAGYDLGMANISNNNELKLKNRNAYISAGLIIF